jgi:hypothetical protein
MLRLGAVLRIFYVLIVGLLFSAVPLTAQDALTQTFTAQNGLYSLDYPQGWVYDLEPNGLVLANSLASLTQYDDSIFPPLPNTILLAKLDLLTGLSASRQDLTQPLRPEVVASMLQQSWLEAGLVDTVGEVQTFYLGQHATASVALASSQQQAEAIIFVTEISGCDYVFIAMGSLGQLAAYQPTFLSIVESLEIQAVAQSAPTPDQLLQIGAITHAYLSQSHTDCWYFEAQAGEAVTIALVGNFDTFLELYAPDGALLAQNDDVDISYASLIENITLPTSGEYRIVVRAFSVGSGPYVLVVGHPNIFIQPDQGFAA